MSILVKLGPVLWIRIRMDSYSFGCPGSGSDWECGSGSRGLEIDQNLQFPAFQKGICTFVGMFLFYLLPLLRTSIFIM
jgi:hypothetical protein